MSTNVLDITEVFASIKNQEAKVEATANIMFPCNEDDVNIPDEYKFIVTIKAISEKEAAKISKKINTRKFNKETQRHEVVVDSETFVDIVFRTVVTGWSGLTVKKWRYFVKTYPLQGFNENDEIPYSVDLAKILVMEGISLGDSVASLLNKSHDVVTFNATEEVSSNDITLEDEIKN